MLVDRLSRPIKDLRLSVMDACNFRCPYCMPKKAGGYTFLKEEELLTFDEIHRVAGIMISLGVDKIKITGGEPMLRPWLPSLISRLAAFPQLKDLALITNGTFLDKQARRLYEAGLHRITLSMDAITPQVYQQMTGGHSSLENVLKGIEKAREAGFSSLKINTVLQPGKNRGELMPLVEYFRKPHFTLRFIEYMDVGGTESWSPDQVIFSDQIRREIHKKYPLEAVAAARKGEVAQLFRYKDGQGKVGFVSSVSSPFCQDCVRVRLSASGVLYSCLFSKRGLPLKPLLRGGAGDKEITQAVSSFWGNREDRYSEQREELRKSQSSQDMIPMHKLGG